MSSTRRAALGSLLAAPALIGRRAFAATRNLKISHQFPSGASNNQGDFRDRLVRRFAADVQRRTNGELTFEIYPNSSLMRTVGQFSALCRGELDFSLYPLAYAGDEMIEVNIGLMPCLVTTYEQGLAWKRKPVGRELTNRLEERGVRIVTWIWQAGGIASRDSFVVEPDDVRGLKIRGGSREMDLMLKAAGAIIGRLPSDEIYAAMQAGALDAAVTSSTSLMSFRLEQFSKAITTGRNGSFWFMLEPLLMSKQVYDGLTPMQQRAIDAAGLQQEAFAMNAARQDDEALAGVYAKVGVAAKTMNASAINKWRELAHRTAWKDFADRNASCRLLLKLAELVP